MRLESCALFSIYLRQLLGRFAAARLKNRTVLFFREILQLE